MELPAVAADEVSGSGIGRRSGGAPLPGSCAGSPGRAWFPPPAVLVLLVAGALRFHDLGAHSLRGDEAAAALNAWGTVPELVERTQTRNSTPILYPLLLWVVQKIEISAFSVRLLPAVGSLLTVAVLLFGLPLAGVSRRPALLAGTLAALSWAAVYEAQGAREYSLDALVAAVGIVALLRTLRDGCGGAWLGGSLFLGPLVQYGLVLFSAATLITAYGGGGVIPDGPGRPGGEPRSGGGRRRSRPVARSETRRSGGRCSARSWRWCYGTNRSAGWGRRRWKWSGTMWSGTSTTCAKG